MPGRGVGSADAVLHWRCSGVMPLSFSCTLLSEESLVLTRWGRVLYSPAASMLCGAPWESPEGSLWPRPGPRCWGWAAERVLSGRGSGD